MTKVQKVGKLPKTTALMPDIYGYRSLRTSAIAFLAAVEFFRFWISAELSPPSQRETRADWTEEGLAVSSKLKAEYQQQHGRHLAELAKMSWKPGVHYVVKGPTEYDE